MIFATHPNLFPEKDLLVMQILKQYEEVESEIQKIEIADSDVSKKLNFVSLDVHTFKSNSLCRSKL